MVLLLIALLIFFVLIIWKLQPGIQSHFSFFKLYNKHSTAKAPILPFNYGLGQIVETSDVKKGYTAFLDFAKRANENGGIIIGHFGHYPWIFVSDPTLVKQLVYANPKKVGKALTYDVLRNVLGNGLVFNTDYDLWKKQRNTMNPIFAPPNIKNLYSMMQQETLNKVQEWENEMKGQQGKIEIDLCSDFSKLTLGIISACAFGLDTQKQEHRELLKNVTGNWNSINKDVMVYFAGASISETLFNWLPLESTKRLRRSVEELRSIGRKLIEERRREPNGDGKRDLLASLLNTKYEDGSGMPEDLMIDEIVVFLLAGHETTSGLLSFMFYLLATHPEIKQKCKEEISEKIKAMSEEQLFSFEGIKELTFLEQVINETLRLYPSAYLIDKVFTEDEFLVEEQAEKKHYIPKGTIVSINILGLHRNPKVWEHADTFDPDRWTEENMRKHEQRYPLSNSFMSFSAGNRNCIGKFFAMVEAKMIAAMALHRFDFVLNPKYHKQGEELEIEAAITIKPTFVQVLMQQA